MLVLESIQTILVGYDAYQYFVVGFGDIDNLDRVHFQWFEAPFITGIGNVLSSSASCLPPNIS